MTGSRHDSETAQRPAPEPEQAFLELSQILLGSAPLGQILQRVAVLAKRTVPGADEVSVTLVEDGKARSVGFTGPLAVALDERQYEKGFGPCLDACETGQLVEVRDTSSDVVYPEFARQAARAGVRSSASVGMPVPQRIVGALNLYRTSEERFDERSLSIAQTFASYAGVALANASLYASAAALAEHMQVAMTSRAVIEQAKGMIMASNGCTADEAFALLAQASQRANRKLRVLAEEVVARRGELV